jgi:hypothetical protein
MQLFREDVLRHQVENHLGAIRLGRPLSFAARDGHDVVRGAALVIFAARAHLTRKATLNGLLWPAHGDRTFGMAEGRITAVSHTPIAPQDLPPGIAAREPLYRMTVQLARQSIDVYGKSEALKPGLTLRAEVHQDRRVILEWLMEPVLSASHRADRPGS